jgi:PAS domain S-box-containing protein
MTGRERSVRRKAGAKTVTERKVEAPANLGAGSWRWDVGKSELSLSPECKLLYEAKASRLPVSSLQDMYGHAQPEDRRRLLGRINDALMSGREGYEELFRGLTHDSGERHILTRAKFERDARGRLVGVSGIDIDLTSFFGKGTSHGPTVETDGASVFGVSIADRSEAERRLRESEERYRELADFMPQIVWQTDATGIIQYVNNRWTELTGIPVSDATGKPWLPGMMPGDLQRAQRAWIDAQEPGRFYEHEWRLRLQDGSQRWLLTRGRPIRDEGGRILRWIGTDTDITARKEDEAKQRESEVRLELATLAAGLGIWDWDLLTNRFIYSARAKAICGFAQDQEVTFKDVRRVTHPEDLAMTSAQARRALDPVIRDNQPYEYRIVRPDGEIRRVVAHGSAVFAVVDGEEKAVRYVGTLMDVTDRWQLEQQKHISEARLKLAVEAGRMAVWEADLVNDRIVGSPELNRLLGFADDARPSLEDIRARYYPGERERVTAIAKAALARGERFFEAEYRCVWEDGSVHWLLLRAEFDLDPKNQPMRLVGVIMDITDRMETEQAMRESKDRIRIALAAAQLGDWTWDATSDRVEMSARAHEIYGMAHGSRLTWTELQSLLQPEDAGRAAAAVDKAIRENLDYDAEYRVNQPGGQQVWVAARGRPFYRDDGSPGGMIGVVQDISERKRHEQHLRLLINELNHRVKNTLATVQSMATLTLRNSADMNEARTRFEARLIALAGAHDALTRENWEGASLTHIVEQGIAPYRSPERERFSIAGPDIIVSPKYALALAMALHELCTNAVKYGALSNAEGRVDITWGVAGEKDGRELHLRWQERDGPTVMAPTRRGFGSRLIEQGLARDLAGEVEIDYAVTGLVCVIKASLETKSKMLEL